MTNKLIKHSNYIQILLSNILTFEKINCKPIQLEVLNNYNKFKKKCEKNIGELSGSTHLQSNSNSLNL